MEYIHCVIYIHIHIHNKHYICLIYPYIHHTLYIHTLYTISYIHYISIDDFTWFWMYIDDHCSTQINQDNCEKCASYSISFYENNVTVVVVIVLVDQIMHVHIRYVEKIH